MPETDFPEVFAQLRAILREHADVFVVKADTEARYSLDARYIMPNRQPLFLGAVEIRKNYVSFHLLPLYMCPTMLEQVSPALRARMQGKACFNFKRADPALFEELAALTRAGVDLYRQRGYLAET